jgi:hypothetical protein
MIMLCPLSTIKSPGDIVRSGSGLRESFATLEFRNTVKRIPDVTSLPKRKVI